MLDIFIDYIYTSGLRNVEKTSRSVLTGLKPRGTLGIRAAAVIAGAAGPRVHTLWKRAAGSTIAGRPLIWNPSLPFRASTIQDLRPTISGNPGHGPVVVA